MAEYTVRSFSPRDGAVLELESLSTIADIPQRLLAASLTTRWPNAPGLVLSGFELSGPLAAAGPPGTVTPDAEVGHAVLSPGTAVLRGRDGKLHLFRARRPVRCDWPDAGGPRVQGALVAFTEASQGAVRGGLSVAFEEVEVQLGFVRPDMASEPHLLPLAVALGNGRDWATDLATIYQPDHRVIRALLERFDQFDQSVWQAEPEGSVWDRQVLGRSWVRYQTVAASALQAARMVLSMRETTTLERVRVLQTLRTQLESSVEQVATELLQIIGSPEEAGPYAAVLGRR